MANLAIKGHKTRGKEVIEILEMLGGKNTYRIDAIRDYHVYFILEDKNRTICSLKLNQVLPEQFIIFTLEEFLEKFPYKVGDLIAAGNIPCKILSAHWSNGQHEVHYTIENYQGIHTAEYLQPYKEPKSRDGKVESFEILESHCADEVKIEFDPSKYEIVEKENGYYVVKKLSQYPKTYVECCRILNHIPDDDYVGGYKDFLLENLKLSQLEL